MISSFPRFPSSCAVAIAALACAAACGAPDASRSTASGPNVLWIIWDTVRADRMSLYGHERPTTPFLESWAADARVFDDCISTAGSTVPSHASMFTGLLPSEHGTHNANRTLDPNYTTIAELLRDAGYATYLFAANPHIQQKTQFTQGFDVAEHPWSDKYRERAIEIVRGKIAPGDRSSLLPQRLQAGEIRDWYIKASGELAREGLVEWLERRERAKPFFAFLNYMEAHTPYIPPYDFRERLMSREQVTRSYAIDNRHITRWSYTFGQVEIHPDDLELLGAVYDATLLELDTLLRELLTDLDDRGHLENTVVILASDHGEQLGEHHMLDHQYALYDELLRVPLIVHYPERFAPGRDRSPVVTYDIFPTLLDLCGVRPPAGLESQAVSLLDPRRRLRLAEYPVVFEPAIRDVARVYPDWDPTSWIRRLRALYDGRHKLICSTDGRHELYDIEADPGEAHDLYSAREDLGAKLMQDLLAFSRTLTPMDRPPGAEPRLTEEEIEMLTGLGYLGGGETPQEDLDVEPAAVATCGF